VELIKSVSEKRRPEQFVELIKSAGDMCGVYIIRGANKIKFVYQSRGLIKEIFDELICDCFNFSPFGVK